jgi:anti-sigma factor RsiW
MSWLRKNRDKTEHGYVAERLSAYLDGQLTLQEQAAVDEHVATCEACRWDLATLQQTVQWTRELPTVPVPRVFTIPVEAQPERPARRRWRLVPVLQGATALVALLLFFVVAGDIAFRGAMPAMAPAPAGMLERQAIEYQATQVVEVAKEMEELPLAQDATVAEKAISEPEAVSLPQAAVPTVAVPEVPVEAEAASEEPEAVGSEPQAEAAGAGEAGAPLEEAESESQEKVQVDRVVTEASEVALTATLPVTVTEGLMASPSAPAPTLRFSTEHTAATGEPEPTVIVVVSTPTLSPTPAALGTTEATPTPLPTATAAAPSPTSVKVKSTPVPTDAPSIAATEVAVAPTPVPQPTAAPTVVAEALPPASQGRQSWDEELVETRPGPPVDWVRVFELGLGMVLVFLVAATIVLMVQRRRA